MGEDAMKPNVTPSDLKAVNDALSFLSVSEQWNNIVRTVGIDTTAVDERIEANKRICTGLIDQLTPLVGAAV